MSTRRDPKDDPAHIPIEKRLSGDFGSPLELMATQDLKPDQKRAILEVWLEDIDGQPDSTETRELRASVREALRSVDGTSQAARPDQGGQ